MRWTRRRGTRCACLAPSRSGSAGSSPMPTSCRVSAASRNFSTRRASSASSVRWAGCGTCPGQAFRCCSSRAQGGSPSMTGSRANGWCATSTCWFRSTAATRLVSGWASAAGSFAGPGRRCGAATTAWPDIMAGRCPEAGARLTSTTSRTTSTGLSATMTVCGPGVRASHGAASRSMYRQRPIIC